MVGLSAQAQSTGQINMGRHHGVENSNYIVIVIPWLIGCLCSVSHSEKKKNSNALFSVYFTPFSPRIISGV